MDSNLHEAQVGIWLWEAMDLQSARGRGGSSLWFLGLTEATDHRSSVMDIPDVIVCCGRAENKVRALGATRSAPELKGEWSRGIRHSVAPRM